MRAQGYSSDAIGAYTGATTECPEFPAGGNGPCRCTAHPYSLSNPRSAPSSRHLQQAIEAAGAESVVPRNASEAEQHCDQLQFTAALLNVEHRAIEDDLSAKGLPVLLYSRASMPRAIIASLQRLLEVGR